MSGSRSPPETWRADRDDEPPDDEAGSDEHGNEKRENENGEPPWDEVLPRRSGGSIGLVHTLAKGLRQRGGVGWRTAVFGVSKGASI